MNTFFGTCVEIFGVIAALVYVYLEIKQSRSMWIVGIVSSLVYVYVFFASKFYADAGLNVYYALASVYGMWCWRSGAGRSGQPLPITRITRQQGVVIVIITAALWIGMRTVLAHWTDSPVPSGDALITALGIVGTYMLARKILEQWHVWIVANTLSLALFLYKGLYPTAGLYIVYTILSFYGLWRWRRTMNKTLAQGGAISRSPDAR